ncbi:hypothetical protein [Paenibacillus motobuensis]|uniref:Uncharacterized protein n=1 Tax=Paenibacillus motobuensis TaxID=295324 RepID=A0ABP3IDU4_9BACL
MSYVELSKFPVTALDGAEYRVKIVECRGEYGTLYVAVRLYVRRKWFGFRNVYQVDYEDGKGVYYRGRPNFKRIVAEALASYERSQQRRARELRQDESIEQERRDEIARFAEWDGRIAE